MADQSDVENALVTLVADALYPSGNDGPSITGSDCRIYRGWPTSGALDADLSAGRLNITIFPAGEPGQNTTRYISASAGASTQPGLSIAVSGVAVTFSGSATAGQVAGILVNSKLAYTYRTKTGDTPEIVAANLAASARQDWIVNLSGATMTVPGAVHLLARTVDDAATLQEIRRQQQKFRITCWCPTPSDRDSAAAAIDQSLAVLPFIALGDGSRGRLRYYGTLVFDQSQDALLYRRDLLYEVEYPSICSALLPAMLFGQLTLNADTFIA